MFELRVMVDVGCVIVCYWLRVVLVIVGDGIFISDSNSRHFHHLRTSLPLISHYF